MNPSVFLDTNYLCALYNVNDSLYDKAKSLAKTLKGTKFIITNFILLESYTILSQRASKAQSMRFGNYVRRYNPYDIFWIDKELEEKIWKIFKKIKDKNFSYVDASILAVMKKEKIKHLLSFDDSFKNLQKQFSFQQIGV